MKTVNQKKTIPQLPVPADKVTNIFHIREKRTV